MTLKAFLVSAAPGFLRPYWKRLEASPLGYRLARGAFWSLSGAVISRGLGLVSSILVARMLGKVGFGELGIIQSTVGLFGTFAGFGLGLTATKYVAEFRIKDPARAGRIIGLSSLVSWITGGIMSVLLVFSGPWLATHTLAAPHLGGVLQVGSLLLLLGAINGAQTGALAGFEAFKRIAHINLVAGIAAFLLMVGGAWWRGLEGAVLGLVLSHAFNCLLNYAGLRAEAHRTGVPLVWAGSSSESSVLWSFSLPAVGSGLMVTPVYWLCNTMLVNSPGGYGQMGLFNAANQWFGALLFLPETLGRVVLPVLSETIGKNEHANSRKVLAYYIKLNAAVAAPVLLLGCVASSFIMTSYGPGFAEGWPILIVVLITAAFLAIQGPVGHVIAASGRMWLGSMMNLGWAACFIFSTWLFIDWGAFGLANARLLAYATHGIWTFAFAAHLLKPTR